MTNTKRRLCLHQFASSFKTLKLLYLTILFLTFSIVALNAATIYVDQTASGANNGTSWFNAYTDLQPALDAANVGDEIWVAAGTYFPTEKLFNNANDRLKTFHFNKDLNLYGGFNGTESSRNQRNPSANLTKLSGDIGVSGDNSDNSYHVVVAVNQSNSAVIDGFTIEKGRADNNVSPPNYAGTPIVMRIGGGIYTRNSGITISNCVFRNNFALAQGGGLTVWSANGRVERCKFFANVSGSIQGGSIFANNCTITVMNTLFGDVTGSDLHLGGSSNLTVESCTFSDNGITNVNANSTLNIYNSIYLANYVGLTGGTAFWQNCDVRFSGGSGANWDPAYGSDQGGNIDAIPLFTDPNNEDYTLTNCSPCINAGENSINLYSTDIDGNTRVSNGTIDMGCYEYQGAPAGGPTANCQNVTATLGSGGSANANANQVNNGSFGACTPLQFSLSKTAFNCGDIGGNTVTLTVTDAGGKHGYL